MQEGMKMTRTEDTKLGISWPQMVKKTLNFVPESRILGRL
jgi:hypothetical protein